MSKFEEKFCKAIDSPLVYLDEFEVIFWGIMMNSQIFMNYYELK